MSITSIQRDTNNNVSLVRIITTDPIATVASADYILNQQENINTLNGGIWSWYMTDMILCAASDTNAFLLFTDDTFSTLALYGEQGHGTVNPGLANQIAYYVANGSTISGLATLANGVLATNGSSVPAITQTLPSAVQNNITAVGTISSGTWHGTAITVPFGGTGNTTFTAYSVICAGITATGTFQNVSGVGTTGQILTSNGAGALPTWQTNAASGTVNPGTINDLAFYAATGSTVSALPTANSSVLVTSGLGVPSLSTTLPNGLAMGTPASLTLTNATGLPLGTGITTTFSNGGIVYSTASALALLAGTATANLPLLSGASSAPSWGAFALSLGGALTTAGAFTLSGAFSAIFTLTNTTSVTFPTSGTLATTSQLPTLPLSLANGGTGASLVASNGGIFYSNASTGAILAGTATANQVLLSGASTNPAWSTATYPATTTINQLLYSSSANVIAGLATVNSAGLLTNGSGVPAWVVVTGTGSPVLATSPVISAPQIGQINDPIRNLQVLSLGSAASAVNFIALSATATGVPPVIAANGSDTNISLNLAGKGTGGVRIVGYTDGSSAASGQVGEVISSTVTFASPNAYTSSNVTTITSINLTAGNWDIYGNTGLIGTTVTNMQAGISLTTNTLPATEQTTLTNPVATTTVSIQNVPSIPVTISSTTTYYLVVFGLGTGTMHSFGTIYARRRI